MSANSMNAKVTWVEGMTFVATSGSGHQVVMDGDSPGKAPSPMEMALMSAGSCASVDVVSILQKAKQKQNKAKQKVVEKAKQTLKEWQDCHKHILVYVTLA